MATPVELVGGAVDGEIVYPLFSLDLLGLSSCFDEVTDFRWHAHDLSVVQGLGSGWELLRRRRCCGHASDRARAWALLQELENPGDQGPEVLQAIRWRRESDDGDCEGAHVCAQTRRTRLPSRGRRTTRPRGEADLRSSDRPSPLPAPS